MTAIQPSPLYMTSLADAQARQSTEELDCPICLQALKEEDQLISHSSEKIHSGEKITHSFHLGCIASHIHFRLKDHVDPTCPQCTHPIDFKNVEDITKILKELAKEHLKQATTLHTQQRLMQVKALFTAMGTALVGFSIISQIIPEVIKEDRLITENPKYGLGVAIAGLLTYFLTLQPEINALTNDWLMIKLPVITGLAATAFTLLMSSTHSSIQKSIVTVNNPENNEYFLTLFKPSLDVAASYAAVSGAVSGATVFTIFQMMNFINPTIPVSQAKEAIKTIAAIMLIVYMGAEKEALGCVILGILLGMGKKALDTEINRFHA